MGGIVVEDLETGLWYARSEQNFNPEKHRKVRSLLPNETVLGYGVKLREDFTSQEDQPSEEPPPEEETESSAEHEGTSENIE